MGLTTHDGLLTPDWPLHRPKSSFCAEPLRDVAVRSSPMLHRLMTTFGFLVEIARDAVGTLRARWRRFQARVVHGREEIAVGVDAYPFFECMTGVGWYEWNLLAALDRRDDGIVYNLYARTFLAPDDPPPPKMPGNRTMRLCVHQIRRFLLPTRPTLLFLRKSLSPSYDSWTAIRSSLRQTSSCTETRNPLDGLRWRLFTTSLSRLCRIRCRQRPSRASDDTSRGLFTTPIF